MPDISVIIPTYQHGDTLKKCLDSVFAQTYKDVEVIVINDGSTDDTAEIVKPYLSRIMYKAITNSGAQRARNTGFDASHGRFIIFCDADVVMKPTMLEKLHAALAKNPDAAYAYCGFRFGWAHFRPRSFSADDLRRLNYIHTTSLVRREDFPRFDEQLKRFHDWDLWLTLLDRGKNGVAVEETLFSATPRRDTKQAYSQWLPKIFFSRFFDALGIRLSAVERYRAAAAVIRRKHELPEDDRSIEQGPSWIWFFSAFALSAAAFRFGGLSTLVSLCVLALAALMSTNRFIYGVAFMLAELIVGSLAGKTLALSFFGFSLPLRYALFAVIGAIWLIRIIQGRIRKPSKSLIAGVAVMLAAVCWGVINGYLHRLGAKDVIFDANAYLALLMLWFFASAVENEKDQRLLKSIVKNGIIALSVLTIAAFYFFSHDFWNPAGVFAYKWLRDSRIAEITALDGGLYRVFIQSQIFCVLAFFMVVLHDPAATFKKYAWGILPVAALIISGSRSYAVGLIAGLIIWMILQIPTINSDRLLLWGVKKISLAAIGGVVIFLLTLYMPLPSWRSQTSFQDMLQSRSVSERDAATTSRWALLKELNTKIIESPVLGSGFGTTVTYKSSDPRIVNATGGAYTTNAFEWNYQDILIKMGLFGLLAYGYLLFAIFSILNRAEPRQRRWLLPAFFALLATNIVSPYLNHPLGIGYLALLLALAETKKGEPLPAAVVMKVPSSSIAAVPAGMAMVKEGRSS